MRVWKIIRRILLMMVLLIVGAMIWLVSPPGLRQMQPRIERALSDAVGADVSLGPLRLRWPLRMDSARITVRDPDNREPLIELKDIRIGISLRQLRQRTLAIYAFDVQKIVYHRWITGDDDASPTEVEDAKRADPRLPTALGPIHRIEMREWNVHQIEFRDFRASVRGAIRMDAAADQADASVSLRIRPAADAGPDPTPTLHGDLDLRIEVTDTRTRPLIRVTAEATDWQFDDVSIQKLSAELGGDPDAWNYALTADGHVVAPWQIQLQGAIDWDNWHIHALALDEFSGQHGELDWALLESAIIQRRETGYALAAFTLRIAEGWLEAAGNVRRDHMDVQAEVHDIALSRFGFAGVRQDQGNLEGLFQLQGDPQNPSARLRLAFENLLPAETIPWDGPPATFTIEHELADRRLANRFTLDGLTGDPVIFHVDVPLAVSLYPFTLDWPPSGPIHGGLAAETDLGELASLFVLDVHRVSGKLHTDLRIRGTVAEPDIGGSISLAGGRYEHDRLGILLQDIEWSFSGQRDQLSIDRFFATDGGVGLLNLRGTVQLDASRRFPFSGDLRLNEFRLLRNDQLEARADGQVEWTGDRLASLMQGRIRVAPVELRIPERLPPSMIDLNVIEYDEPVRRPPAPLAASVDDEREEHDVQLQLTVLIPDRFFVRGRGLDSEWGGELKIVGPAKAPVITGALGLQRGRFHFFGRRLGITRGIITFDGSVPPQPGLDIVAESRAGGITSIFALSGAVDAPQVRLSSIPDMPQDEILARLLFGRESARITAWQAITIAQAVRQLRGGGSTFDLMGQTRRILRVDQIELREREDEGDMAVSVGKYINDRVYVELEQGSVADSTRARVEVELTPSLRLETMTGTEADAGLGLTWTWDY